MVIFLQEPEAIQDYMNACNGVITFDGSFSNQYNSAGIGWVFQDPEHNIIHQSSEQVHSSSPVQTEAFAWLDALKWAKPLSNATILVKVDCLLLLKYLLDLSNTEVYVRTILQDILWEYFSILC